jgi:hypothetical protein
MFLTMPSGERRRPHPRHRAVREVSGKAKARFGEFVVAHLSFSGAAKRIGATKKPQP